MFWHSTKIRHSRAFGFDLILIPMCSYIPNAILTVILKQLGYLFVALIGELLASFYAERLTSSYVE